MRWGRFEFHLIADTEFRLDGGAMFGVIPKVMWERARTPDSANRIRMTTHCWLIVGEGGPVLVDTGIGEKLSEKAMAQFGVDPESPRLLDKLESIGYPAESIRHVVLTHLHFDHCGWNTRRHVADGEEHWVPTFPQATYWLHRTELEAARSPNARDRASYDSRNWEPLFAAGQVEIFEESAEPIPGLRVVAAPGHTAGMCIALLDGEADGTAAFWTDLVPMAPHVATPWVMGYDLYPVTTMANKERWLRKAHREGWLSIFQHDPEVPMGRLNERRPGRFEAVPLAP